MTGRTLRAAALVLLLLPSTPPAFATVSEPITGPARVLDGGTIEISPPKGTTVKLGLYGIVAPGAQQKCMAKSLPWLCGAKSSEHLAQLIGRSQVTCRRVGVDGGSKPVALCVANGRNLSETMVRNGWAAADPQQGKDCALAEDSARRAKTGI